MSYNSLASCVKDLEKNGHLLRIIQEVDPELEAAEIHRRVYEAGGPALLFENIKGSPFPALSNLYGTIERTEFLFRKSLEKVRRIIELKADPSAFARKPLRYLGSPLTALSALPWKRRGNMPVTWSETTIDKLPQIKAWPKDGGAFITLPQVLTLPPGSRKIMESNLGMYRIQLSGNDYVPNEEVGMHYQIHRGIGVHHTAYNQTDKPFRASIFVGGPPSHSFAAIMPLPEGLSELTFAGMLGGRRFRYGWKDDFVLSADADFAITGIVKKDVKKPEGPFGDHLGYYSLEHDFPVMEVEKVYHRQDAIWPFTVVGRPPQEDSSFGYLIHKLVEPLTGQEFPGVREINAVDAAGVHPLLLAVGSERYMPFRKPRPEEILTQANRILGSGQTSLAKFLWIADGGKHPELNTKDIPAFFKHVLERIDWNRDLHFHTKTTIDTLDYSGNDWNAGSKVVLACCGEKRRELSTEIPGSLELPDAFHSPKVVLPGIIAVEGPKFTGKATRLDINQLSRHLEGQGMEGFPLVLVVDESFFVSQNLNNFLWATFTRANPSHDIHGVGAFVENKHWGCRGALIIDSRVKPHHAPELVPDEATKARVDQLFAKGGPLHGVI